MTEKEQWEDISRRYEEFYLKVKEVADTDKDNLEKRFDLAKRSGELFFEVTALAKSCQDIPLTKEYLPRFTEILAAATSLMREDGPSTFN